MTIVEFLEARLAEDEVTHGGWHRCGRGDHVAPTGNCQPKREVAAKRAIIGRIFDYEATIDGEWGCCHAAETIRAGKCPETNVERIEALHDLASVYDSHPDFDPAWAVEAAAVKT